MKTLIRNIVRSLGYDLSRLPSAAAAPAENLVERVCAAARVPVLPCLPQADYARACPPLFPVPTPVPRDARLVHYKNLDAALNNPSMEQYFKVGRDGDRFTLVDDYHESHYHSRQRMLYSAYAKYIGPDLRDRSVLDIGCSSGYYTFYCAKLGAKTALGTDARPEHEGQFALLHAMLGMPSTCQYRHVDMEGELEKLDTTFDVVLAQGVMYHVYDHPRFVRNLFRLTGRMLVLEGGCSGRSDFLCKADLEKTDNLRASIHGPVIYPSLPWMVELLRWAGFREIAYVKLPEGITDVWGFGSLHRAMLVALK